MFRTSRTILGESPFYQHAPFSTRMLVVLEYNGAQEIRDQTIENQQTALPFPKKTHARQNHMNKYPKMDDLISYLKNQTMLGKHTY